MGGLAYFSVGGAAGEREGETARSPWGHRGGCFGLGPSDLLGVGGKDVGRLLIPRGKPPSSSGRARVPTHRTQRRLV